MFPDAFAFSSFFGKKNDSDNQTLPPAATTDEKTKVRQLVADIVEAVNTQDMERFLSLHTDSVVIMKDNQPNAVGKKAVEAVITPLFEAMKQPQHQARLELKIKTLQIVGEWAFGSGDFAFVKVLPNAAEPQGFDSFSFIARRQSNGTWLRSHLSTTGKLITE